jgi:hypothetical protein
VRASYWTAIGLTIAGLVAVLVFQPRWLFLRPAPEPPQLQEASLRLRMFVEIEHIDRFRSANGRLPTSLIEAGGDSVGLTYTPSGRGYILIGKNGAIRVTYRSGTQPESFLGNSYQLVRERAR